jgi:hypothetical protein
VVVNWDAERVSVGKWSTYHGGCMSTALYQPGPAWDIWLGADTGWAGVFGIVRWDGGNYPLLAFRQDDRTGVQGGAYCCYTWHDGRRERVA